MAVENGDIRTDGRNGPRPGVSFANEPPLGELFRQLSEDATRLIRQEVALGKAELRETGSALARDGARIGIAAGLGLLGAMAGTAFLILALGALIDNYWLSSLLVTVAMLVGAAVLGKGAIDDIKHRDLKPTQTLDTLRADADWAKREADLVKQEWKS
jgi:hypothetical protein